MSATEVGKLRAPSYHKFKVRELAYRGNHTDQERYCQQGVVFPRSLHSLALRADVKVVRARALTELVGVYVKGQRHRWPESQYMTGPRKIRCGCEGCQAKQANGAANTAASDGEGYTRRRVGLSQATGYWTPANFVQHVLGCKIGGGRQPPGVPKLVSDKWLRFELPPHHEDGRTTELRVRHLKREFRYEWRRVKPIPA